MSTLTGRKIANSYKNLLQVETSNTDLDTSLKSVQTGAGNNTPLQLSTDKINLTGTLQIDGTTLTAGAATLNAVADLTGTTGIVAVSAGNIHGRSIAVGNPLTISNANGTEGNPTINLASSGVSAATYGPMVNFTVDNFGRITDVTVTTTISANAFVGGTISGSALTVENDTSIGGDVVIEGTTNMKAISATDVTFNNLTVNTKINAVTVTATTIETSILRATTISVTDLTADNISFENVSVSSLVANVASVGKFNGNMTIESTADGGPILTLVSNDPNDAGSFDNESTISFKAENDADQQVEYAQIRMVTADETDGTEDGRLVVALQRGGSGVVNGYQLASNRLFLENDNHAITWNNTRGTSFDVDLITATPTATRTITLPDATGTVLLDTGNQTLTGDLTFPDDEELKIGTDGDLRIYHNSNNSYIDEGSGTGALIFKSSLYSFRNAADSAQMAIFNQGGNVRLFHAGAEKFQTKSDGVNIFGDARIRATNDDANQNPSLILDRQSASPADDDNIGDILFRGKNDANEDVEYAHIAGEIADVTNGTEDGRIAIEVMRDGTLTRMLAFNGAAGQMYASFALNMQQNNINRINQLSFEGSTNDTNDTILKVADPTATRTITLPDATGTVLVDDGSGNVSISGNLTVSGTTTTVNSSTLSVQDPLIILANNNNSSDVVDIGFYGLYDTSGSQDLYAGLFRDASDSGKFKLFKDLQVEPTTTVNTSGTGYAVGTLVSNLELTTASQIVVNSVGAIPFMEVKGTGPNFIRFLDNESVNNGVNLVYRVTPHDLRIERSLNSHIIAEFGGDDGHAALYFANSKKFETTTTGATLTGTLVSNVISIADGSSTQDRLTIGTNDDFFIYHDNQTVIANVNGSGPIKIQAKFGEQSIVANQDAGVELYYNHSKIFETTSTGVTIEDPSDAHASKSLRIIGKRSDANDSFAFAGKLMLATNRTDQLLDTGKTIGIIGFGGNHTNGTVGNILYSSAITGVSEGDFNSATDMPTGLAFFTGSTGRDPDTPNISMGTERMRIDKDGNVGIGTTSPQTKLDIRVSGSDANNTANLSADFDTWIRLGDVHTGKTFTNGTGIKFADSGLVHWSAGILSDGKFAIAKTSSNGNQLFPSDKNDAFTIDSSLNVNMFGALSITSTDAGASSAPLLELYRHSASPDVGDFLGRIDFYGEDDNDDKVRYASITSSIFHPTNGNERGRLEFDLMQNGSMFTYIELVANGINLNKFTTITGDTLITNGDDDADADPTLTLRRTSASPAFNDQLGELVFQGRNSASQNVNYGRITTKIATVTDGNEGGNLSFNVLQGGSEVEYLQMAFNNIYINKQLTMFNNIFLDGGYGIKWDGSTNDSNTTTLVVTDPTAVRTITLPNASGNVQLNQGSGETNGGFQNFQQDYQSSSYFTAGEYIEVATISPGGDSRNYNFTGTIMAQVSQNVQVLDINVGIRFSSTGNISYNLLYNSHQIGDDYVEPVLWVNTSTDTIKLVIQGKTGSIHKVGVNLTFFQRSNYDDITWNTTVVQDTSSVPSGFTEYIGEKAFSTSLNGAVELYYDNVKRFETDAFGATVTGRLKTTQNIDIENTSGYGRIEIGGASGGFIDFKSPFSDDFDHRIITTGSGAPTIQFQSDDFHLMNKAGTENYLDATVNGAVNLYYDNSLRFSTTSTGAKITGGTGDGTLIIEADTDNATEEDNALLRLKQDGGLVHVDFGFDANNNILIKGNGSASHLYLQHGDEFLAKGIADGAFELYHDNVKQFETTSTGASIRADEDDVGLVVGKAHIGHVVHNDYGAFSHYDMRNSTGGYALLQSASGQTLLNAASGQTLEFRRNNSTIGRFETDGTLTLLSTDAGATAAPTLSLYRNSASPASSDDIGQIQWFAENDADEKVEYARIDVRNSGVTDGAEYGQMDFMVKHNGGEMVGLRLSFNLVQFYRDLYIGANYKIQFEGSNYNDFETSLTVVSPTADRTITLPDASGTVALLESNGDLILNATDTSNNYNPSLILNRVDTVPADFGNIGEISFQSTNSNSEQVQFAFISGMTDDISDGTEDGRLRFNLTKNGTSFTLVDFDTGGVSLRGGGATNSTAGYFQFFQSGGSLRLQQNSATPTSGQVRTVTFPDASGTVLTTGNSDTPTTTTSSSDADFVLIDDGGTMKKITPSNLGIGSGGGGGGSFNGTLTSTDAGSTAAPILTLDRNSASPADGDFLGDVQFKGRNDAGETITYGSMGVKIEDMTDGTEDSRLIYKVQRAGELKTVLDIKADQFKVNNVSEVLFGDPVSSLKFEGATGDDFELTLAITDPTADRTVTVPDATGTIALKSEYFQAFRSSNSANLTSSFAKIDFDTVTLNSNNSVFVESAGEVTINKTGIFRFSADVTTKITSGGSRSDCEIELQKKPSGGSFSSVTGTTAITYNRTSGRGDQTASINFMISVTSGDTYQVVVKRQGGTDTIVVQGNAARFNIQEVN